MPAAEVEVTADLVRDLLGDQHPDLAGLSIVELANGWDNVMFRLGDELIVRLPRRAAAAALIEHEQRVLPELSLLLPLPIPAPVRVGRAALGYPWSWSVNRWLPGAVAATTPFIDAPTEAERLGRFLAALHTPAPTHAPRNPYRGHFIGDNSPVFRERAERLRGGGAFDVERLVRRWEELVAVDPFAGAPRWIHGDLHALNVLVADGSISAVIDFGDVCAGDPATDLSAAWGMFDGEAIGLVRRSAGDVDDATWQRAEAWALHFAVMYLTEASDNPTMRALGTAMLGRLIPAE